MKKILALFLVVSIAFCFASCGKKQNNEKTEATQILTAIWDKYTEADRFYAGGGDSANMTENVPGKFDITNIDELDATLGLPSDLASKISDAASLIHGMNSNTFTAGCYTLNDGVNAEEFSDRLEDNILDKQWMCGFPDVLVIFSINGNILTAFGNRDVINTFKANTMAAFPDAQLIEEETITVEY